MANILTHPTNGAIYFDDGTAGSSSIPALTGNAVSLNHDGSAGLNIVSKNTTSTDRFTIDGDSGRLFSVNDSLTGTIFSVNDASGLPIVEVESTSSEDTITIGTYNTNALVVKGNLVGIGTSSPATNLHVAGAAPTLLVQSTSGGSATLEIGRTADTEAKIVAGDISAGDLNFYTNGTAALKIISNQNATFTGDVAVSGNLTAPTAGSNENSTKVATTAYVKGQGYITGSGIPTLSGSNSFTNSYNEFGNSTGSVSNDGSWNARLNLAGSSHAKLDVKSVSDGIITSLYSHTGYNAGRIGTTSNHKIEFMTSGSTKATLNTDSTFYLASDRVFADNYHPNADRLTSGRVITLGGDLSGSAEFTGAADITITAAVSNNSHTHTIANITSLQSSLNAKAALASPALTGNPTAPTQSANNNSTRIATTAYVQTEITDLIGGAPGALDTLNELAAAINDDASYASTITTALSGKLGTTAKAADSNLLDGIDSTSFLRSDTTDTATGQLTFSGNIIATEGLFGATGTQAPDRRIWAVSTTYNNWGIFYNEGNPDAIEFKSAGNVNAKINLDDGKIYAEGSNLVWHAGNDGSGSGLDADKLDGLELHTGRNNEANKVVRTDGNGYIQAGWINTTSGNNGTTTISRIYASQDGYIRYYTPANFGAQIGSHISYNDLTNKPTIPSAYSLPAASSSTRGGVKIGYSENNKNYPVETSAEKMFVNVPWTDTNTDTNTTYSAGTGISLSGTTFSLSDTASKLSLSGGTMTGTLNSRDIKLGSGYHLMRSNHHSGHLEGSYNNVGANGSKSNPIYTIGSSYNPNDSTLGNMYGIGYCDSGASFISMTGASGWGMYVAADGDARIYLGGSNGVISSTGEHYVGSSKVFHDTYHPNADKLTTARTIAGTSFDGTANISISYNNLTNKPTIPSAYSLPAASSSTRGGVKIGYSENNKNYPVETSAEKMFVNVPWTDTNTNTTYSAGAGLFLSGTTFTHNDTSSQSSVNNSSGTVIQDITLDTYGHITAIGSANLDGRYYTETESDSLYLRKSGGTISGNIVVNNYGIGNVGLYSATKYQAVWSMGTSYMLPSSGGNTGSLYGLAWTHTNIGGQSKSGLSHQLLVCHNGTTRSAIGSGIWTDGTITTTGHGTSANWNTAYGWGNHASQGYTTNTGDITNVNVGVGLDGGGSSGSVTINLSLDEITLGLGLDATATGLSLDLSELTDMTGSVNTSQDELILLDNGAERRKRFSEIFGSNAYNSTTIPTNTNQLTNGANFVSHSSGEGVAIGASYQSSTPPSNGMIIQGNVGIGTSSVSGYYALQVNGNIQGSYKSFVIDHPTKENKQLAHACLEGPEIGVYFRGKSTSDTIVVADYWDSLVDIDTMTVDLTAIGPGQDLFVSSIKENGDVVVGTNTDEPLNYYYVVYGERKDINKLDVEFEIEENNDEEESIAESPVNADTDSIE